MAKNIKHRKSRFGFLGLFVMVSTTVVAVYMIATTMVFLLGMVPTAVAAFTDSDKEKTAGLTVGSMNFVGVFPILLKLWMNNNTVDQALRLISNPSNWAVMYVPAIIGWGIYYYAPPIVSIVLKKRCEIVITNLEERQTKLVEDWGAEVAEIAMRTTPNRR